MGTESTDLMHDKVSVENLKGVPETLLITLYNRAVESQREDAILRDEKAVAMVEQIDYDFSRFGQGHRFRGVLVHLRFRKPARLKEAVNRARKPAVA